MIAYASKNLEYTTDAHCMSKLATRREGVGPRVTIYGEEGTVGRFGRFVGSARFEVQIQNFRGE